MLTLRDYQQTLIERTRDELRRHRAVVICLATGGGKTAMAAYMIGRAVERGKRCWFVCHRDFLLTQTSAALTAAGVPHGFIAAGRPASDAPALVCSIDTLRRRLDRLKPPDLVIWDEAHHIGAQTWGRTYAWAGEQCRHVGLTATPARLDGRGLDKYFGALVLGPSTRELISRDYLSRYRAYAPSTPSLEGIARRGGDYAIEQLAAVMDTNQIAGNIVGTYQRLANGKRAIYYAVSIDHSQHLVGRFQAAGIAARHLDAQSSTDERRQAAGDIADGSISILCNVDLFGEGFDLSASAGRDVSVEAVGLCRPTQSLTLHLQQIGRALRPKPYEAIILDHAGNLMRHGLPDDPRTWSLRGIERKTRAEDTGPPVRMCDACFGVFPATARRECPYCGHIVPLSPREVEEIQADLVEADRSLLQASRRREVGRAQTLEQLREVGRQRGYRPGWAEHVWRARTEREAGRRMGRTTDLRTALQRSLEAT